MKHGVSWVVTKSSLRGELSMVKEVAAAGEVSRAGLLTGVPL